jgi:hypothetical protein
MRKALGIAVFSGMLGVTFFGVLFTPVFYYTIEWLKLPRGTTARTAPPAKLTETTSAP